MTSKKPNFNFPKYIERLRELMPRHRFVERTLGHIGEHPIVVYTRKAFDPATKEAVEASASVMLSAGVHGDEPAPPLAIARMASEGLFRNDVDWTIFPALNPAGLEHGTRENADGIDLNRDYRSKLTYEVRIHTQYIENLLEGTPLDLALCLHEDYESTGFYIYRVDQTEAATDICTHMLARASEYMSIEPSEEIDGLPAKNGIINPVEVYPETLESREDLPEAAYLYRDYAKRSYTTETPSSAYIETRISAQVAAILSAVETVCQK